MFQNNLHQRWSNVEGVHSCISGTNSSSSNVTIKVSISTQLSCLSPPPLPLSLVTVPTCSTVATPNRTYQWMGQWRKVLGGLLKLKECLLCGTEWSESVRLGSCPPSHNPSPGAVPWGFLGCHRWTFIQLNIIHIHTRARTHTHITYILPYIIVLWNRWFKDRVFFFFLLLIRK